MNAAASRGLMKPGSRQSADIRKGLGGSESACRKAQARYNGPHRWRRPLAGNHLGIVLGTRSTDATAA